MKEAVTKVIDTLTREGFYRAVQKLLERYNKCIATRGDYFEGDMSFMCVLSIKVPKQKKSGNLFNDPRIYIFFHHTTCESTCDTLVSSAANQGDYTVSVAQTGNLFNDPHIYIYICVCVCIILFYSKLY